MTETPLSPAVAGSGPPPAGAALPVPVVRGWLAALLAAVEWALLAAAVGLWVGSRAYSPWMNLGGGLLVGSWLARWLRLSRLTRSTAIDLPLVLFLISVGVAAFVAPDTSAALVRLYLFLGAAALFYALVNAGPLALRLFAYAFIGIGAALAVYFASQHNWAEQPAKFAIVGSLGRQLSQAVPDLGLYKPHPNVAASVLAVAGPVALACFGHGLGRLWQTRRLNLEAAADLLIGGLGGLVILLGIIASESRTAALALAVALAVAGWWALAGRVAGGREPTGARVFWAGIALAVLAGAATVGLRPQLLTAAFGSLPGPNSVVSRVEIYGQVWRLAQDTPFTGGGLDSFPGLYSTYILVIPSLFLTHAHNAYLNVLVEQGWLGLIGYVGLIGAGLWAASGGARRAGRWPVAAGALGLVVVLVHGFGEGSLVASRAIPALLIPAGLALAGEDEAPVQPASALGGRWRWALAGALILGLAGAGLVWRGPLTAAWHANLGALAFERADAAAWMSGEWDDGRRAPAYAAAEPELQKAVEYQPGNRTANQRLGLAAISRRDFAPAADYLRRAYAADAGHRGVIKSLGFTYVWLGETDLALPLLARLPEAQSELAVYEWWWGTQGRPDLGQAAQQAAARLAP